MSRLINADDVKKRGDCYPPEFRSVMSNILRHTKTIKDVAPVKHGHWITKTRHEHYPSGKEYEEDYCSACSMRGSIEYDYCPHCGAKMDEAFEWLD